MAELIISTASLITSVGVIIGVLRSVKPVLSGLRNGQRCMLRSNITDIYYRHIDQEEPTLREYERKNLDDLYAGYKALGGNHFIDDLYAVMRRWRVEK